MGKLVFSEKVLPVGKVFARFTMDERSSIRGANSEHQAINKDIVSNSMSRWIWKVVS